jgi:hypothetical protein
VTPGDLPVEDYVRERRIRCDAALARIARFNRAWLIGQLATALFLVVGFLAMGPESWVAMLLTAAAWGVSMLAAGVGACVTFWNWAVLPGAWRAVGLAPWAVLLLEVTFAIVDMA